MIMMAMRDKNVRYGHIAHAPEPKLFFYILRRDLLTAVDQRNGILSPNRIYVSKIAIISTRNKIDRL